ncbi:BatA domain-containing protein [Magnetococcales bacterium HHB-1]
MTFLNPLYLWFLPLVAIPVIIHLLAKRRSRLIEFPSLIFLKKLEQDALRKFNVKQLLLLIIRSLIILLIVLAFSRPTLNSDIGLGFHLQKSDLLVVVLDNTASTKGHYDELVGPWLGELRTSMEDRGTEVWFCEGTSFELVKDHRTIVPTFDDIYDGSLLERISDQVDIFRFKERSLVWVGDGQDVNQKLADFSDWDIYLMQKTVSDDAAILSLDLPSRVLKQQETYTVGVQVGRGQQDSELALELFVNDKRVNQSIIETGKQSVELAARVLESGVQEGYLELDGDAHPYNDSRFFALEAGSDRALQIVGSENTPDFWNMTRTALEAAGANLSINVFPYSRIDELNLGLGGTILIDDGSRIPDYVWSQLELFLKRGGQLILFGDGGTSMHQLLDFKGEIASERSQYAFGLDLTPAGSAALGALPLKAIVDQNRLKIFRRFNIESSELERTWVRFLDGQPFLGESPVHEGRIVWFNTTFSLESTNLPLLGIFPAMILDLAQYESQEHSRSENQLQIGDTLTFVPQTIDNTSLLFSIQRPDGTVDFQQPDSSYTIQYTRTDIPGIYHWQRGRENLHSVAVNVSSHEALAHQTIYTYDQSFAGFTEGQLLVNEILERSTGVALWPVLLLLLLLLWLAEIWLSRIRSTWRSNDRDK